MQTGEFVLFLTVNGLTIYGLHYWHKASINNLLKNLRQEIVQLEDLVAAIIEEFEEVAEGAGSVASDQDTRFLTDEAHIENVNSTINPIPELLQEPSIIPSPSPSPVNPDRKHQQVLEMWEQGMSVSEIARQLGTGRGEVQLIVGLYRKG